MFSPLGGLSHLISERETRFGKFAINPLGIARGLPSPLPPVWGPPAIFLVRSTVKVKKKLYIENAVYLRAPWELDGVLRTQYISVLPEYEV